MVRYTTSVEIAGKVLGIGRGVAYQEAKPGGVIPTVRLGRRIVVPIAKLAETLGTTPEALSQAIDAFEAGTDPATQQLHAQVA
jgi:hypothetical protein